ncbi:hypothetical protein IHE45_14G055400 [Dioscorea alata]|uniref:Uncharacterized protein n=1 Tax=Dioscorea alata TaxID=55571 RepID=A0ACB7URZ3_DIOAL|nr:hypothetical protein IHE45_14G055400 [Dioscorea alata]
MKQHTMLDHNSSNNNNNNNHTTKPPKKNNSKKAIDHHTNDHDTTPQESISCPPPPCPPSHGVDDAKKRVGDGVEEEVEGREKLKRHRRMTMEKGQLGIPEVWGHEELLQCWFDCSAFQSCYSPAGLVGAREALARQRTRPSCTSADLKVELEIQKSS